MLILRKNKRNKDEDMYKDCLELFYKSKDDSDEKRDHDDILILYNEIEKYYKEKIKCSEINIKAEKIRLEQKIGKYANLYRSNTSNLFVGVIPGIFILFFDKLGIFDDIMLSSVSPELSRALAMSMKFVSFSIISGFLLKFSEEKNLSKDKNSLIINNIKLKVLNDIEKEVNEGNFIVKQEVGATVKKQDEQVKRVSNQANGNWNVDIHLLSVFGIIEGTYRTVKFISKVIKRKKK